MKTKIYDTKFIAFFRITGLDLILRSDGLGGVPTVTILLLDPRFVCVIIVFFPSSSRSPIDLFYCLVQPRNCDSHFLFI